MDILCMYFLQSVFNSILKKAKVFDEMEVVNFLFYVLHFLGAL